MRRTKRKRSYKVDRLRIFAGRRTVPCHWCQRPLRFDKATIEHIDPLGEGGSNDKGNLTVACEECQIRRNKEQQKRRRQAKLERRLRRQKLREERAAALASTQVSTV